MDNRFLQAISTQSAPVSRYSIDRLLLFTKSEWMAVAQNRRAMLMLSWMTLFIFMRWAVDCISNGGIDWQAYQYPVTFLLFVSLFVARWAGRAQLVPYIIIALVLLLNELGFWTESCCSGHPDPSKPDEDDDGYVSFYFERDHSLFPR